MWAFQSWELARALGEELAHPLRRGLLADRVRSPSPRPPGTTRARALRLPASSRYQPQNPPTNQTHGSEHLQISRKLSENNGSN